MKGFKEILLDIWKSYYDGFVTILPKLLAAVLIVVGGWILAKILSVTIRRVLKIARFDHFCSNSGFTHLLNRADVHSPPSYLAGKLVFWVVFMLIIMSGLSALGLDIFKYLASEFLLYLPNVVTAILILIGGGLMGAFLSRAVLLAAVNADLPSPRTIGLIVKYLIVILSFAMALEQLKVAGNIVTAAFTITFGAIMLSLAIAFGLGGRDVARRVLEDRLAKAKENDKDELKHI